MSDKTHISRLESERYYDLFSEYYTCIFDDFWEMVEYEKSYYSRIFQRLGTKTILDCTCGPGTQAIGLRELGLDVTGLDVSKEMLRIASANAEAKNLKIEFRHGSFLQVRSLVKGTFDAVLSAGNSIPHAGSYRGVKIGLSQMMQMLNRPGALILNLRDYEAVMNGRPCFHYQKAGLVEGKRILINDFWNYLPDNMIHVHFFVLELNDQGELLKSSVRHFHTKVYPVTMCELESALSDLGFESIEKLRYRDRGFYTIIARM